MSHRLFLSQLCVEAEHAGKVGNVGGRAKKQMMQNRINSLLGPNARRTKLNMSSNTVRFAASSTTMASAPGGTSIEGRSADCIPEDWNIVSIVLISFVILAGLVWHTTAVIPGIGGMQGHTGGVFLALVVLAAIIAFSMYALRDQDGGDINDERSADYELAAVILGTIVTGIFIFAMAFAWDSWAKNKDAVSVGWPVTHTIITATAIALNIGLPIAYNEACGGVGA